MRLYRNLGSFQFGAITNNVAINILIHAFAEETCAFLLGTHLERVLRSQSMRYVTCC